MTFSEEAIERAARHMFLENYPNGAWALVRGNEKKRYMRRARGVVAALRGEA